MPQWNENPRILFPILMISVALNLAVAGYFISHDVRARMTHDRIMHARMEGMVGLLPEESRASIRKELDAKSGEIRHNMSAIHRERKKIRKMIQAETLDVEALDKEFEYLRTLHSQTQKIFQDTFSHAVAKLPPEKRRLTAAAIKERHAVKSPEKNQASAP